MENIIADLLAKLPDFIGLAVAVVILYRQNNKLLDAVLRRVEALEKKLDDMPE